MAHIHTRPGDHDHTVSFFIIRTDFSEPRLILHRHRRLGKLMMFGGHVELNENPWQAAVRELREESGYSPEQLNILQPERPPLTMPGAAVHPVPVCQATGAYPGDVSHFHADTAYAFTTGEAPHRLPDSGESRDFLLVTAGELEALTDEDIEPMFKNLGRVILSWYLPNWNPVRLLEFDSESATPRT